MNTQWRIRSLTMVAALAGLFGLQACDSDSSPPAPVDHGAEEVAAIQLSSPKQTLEVGASVQLRATPMCAHGLEMKNIPLEWTSTAPERLEVSPSGMVTALRSGQARVRVTAQRVTREMSLEINAFGKSLGPAGGELSYRNGAAKLVVGEGALERSTRLTVEEAEGAPRAGSGSSVLVPGTAYEFGPHRQQFRNRVEMRFQYEEGGLPDNADERRLRVHRLVDGAWHPLEDSSVDPDANVVSGFTSSFSTYGVLDFLPDVGSVEVTPALSRIELGQSTSLEAAVLDDAGEPIVAAPVIWSSGDVEVAHVSQEGEVTGLRVGTAAVSAFSGGVEGGARVEVYRQLSAITVEPAAVVLQTGQTQQLAATLLDEDGEEVEQAVRWSTADAAVATVSASGVVTAVATGETTIMAASGDDVAEVSVTVTGEAAQVVISPRDGRYLVGQSVQHTAAVYDADGNQIDAAVSWSVSDPGMGQLLGPGLVKGTVGGRVTLTASYEELSDRVKLTFQYETSPHDPVDRIALTPEAPEVRVAQTVQLTAAAYDARGAPLPVVISWSSTDESIATVDDDGLVSGLKAGTATIFARADDVVASVELTVLPGHGGPATVDVIPNPGSVMLGETLQLQAQVKDGEGNELTDVAVTYSSADASIATVDRDGLVTGVSLGSTDIEVTAGDVKGKTHVSVTPAAPGGGEEGFGNNLSWPVLFAEGYGIGGAPVDESTGLRPQPAEGIVPDAIPFWYEGNVANYVLDGGDYYTQQSENTWRAEWQDRSDAGAVGATVYWGDNLTHQTWNTHSPIRIEHVLHDEDGPTLGGFDMSLLYGQGVSEMWGATGATSEFQPTVYVVTPRLVIQKLDDVTREPVHTAVDEAIADKLGTDGPGGYAAEVNVAGKLIYGYNFSIRDLSLPPEVEESGWWRISFVLDEQAQVGGVPVSRNVSLQAVGNVAEGEELTYVPDLDGSAATTLDIYIESGKGGGAGGGGGGGHPHGPPDRIDIAPSSPYVGQGGSVQLSATVLDDAGNLVDGALVSWTSSDESVAVVDGSGLVHGVGEGITSITASTGDLSASVTITVGPPDDHGGHEGEYGNNLSVPVIFTDGYGVTGLPVAEDPGLRPLAEEGIVVDGLPFFYDGNAPDLDDYYLQGTANTWQPEWSDGSSAGPHRATIHWGDNLTHMIWSQNSTFSIEQTLTATSAPQMTGFAMPYWNGEEGPTAVWGTDGTTASYTPSIFTLSARLVIQKLDDYTREPVHTVLDAPLTDAFGDVEGPGHFVAEVGVGGSIAYGYTFMLKNLTLPDGLEKAGWWRATFYVDDQASVSGVPVPGNVDLAVLEGADAHELTFVPRIDPEANKSWIDFMVKAEGGGTSGGLVMAVEVTPTTAVVDVGQTSQLSAAILGAGGQELQGRPLTWSSQDPGIATVDQNGVVTGVSKGTTWIIAASGNTTGHAEVSVQPGGGGAVSQVGIVPPAASVELGETVQLTAKVRDADGNLLDRPVSWSTSDQAVATVDGTGLVTGVSLGTVAITATSEGVEATAEVVVSDSHEGGYGSNLSNPVVFSEGIGITGLPVSEDPGLRPTAAENIIVDGLPFWYMGNTVDWVDPYGEWYLQHGPNTWQAEWLDGSAMPERPAEVAWGDNLTHMTWNTHSVIRIENVLYDQGTGPLQGFNMKHLAGQPPDEIWGTDGTMDTSTPTVYSVMPRLTIQKLDNDTREPIHTHFDGSIHEASGEDGPGFYNAEVNRAGKIIYGFGLQMTGVTLPEGMHKYGWWRITFSLDDQGTVGGEQILRNVRLASVAGADDPELTYVPQYDPATNTSWLDIYVESASGGGGGGGGGGGSGAGGPASSISLHQNRPAVAPGDTYQFHPEALDEQGNLMDDALIEWSSSDASVATVDDAGLATGVSTGTSVITAASGGNSASVTMSVVAVDPGGEEGLGNNLSTPLIFTEGYGMTGQPTDADTGLRPTAEEGVVVDALPFWHEGNLSDFESGGVPYYLQQGENTWRAEWLDGGDAVQSARVRWSDNLTHHTWSTHSTIRVETHLSAREGQLLEGFAMTYLYGDGPDEMRGTDGTVFASTPSLFSVVPRLRIEKLDDETLTPVFTAFEGTVAAALVADGPGGFGAEVNVAGDVIYGHNFRVEDIPVPQGIPKYGWWRLTFSLDDQASLDGVSVSRGLSLDECGNLTDGEELVYAPILDQGNQRTTLDIWIESMNPNPEGHGKRGGGGDGGHGGGGGGHDDGACGGH